MSEQHPHGGGIASPEKPQQLEGLEHLSALRVGNIAVSYYGSVDTKKQPTAEYATATITEEDGTSEELLLWVMAQRGTPNQTQAFLLMEEEAARAGENPRTFVTFQDNRGEFENKIFQVEPEKAMDAYKHPFGY